MVDRNRNIFVVNDDQNRHRITQQWSLHAQVTLSNGKPEGKGFEYQRGNIMFSCKPPGADSGYGSASSGRGTEDQRYSRSPPLTYRRSNAGGFAHSQQYANKLFSHNNQYRSNQQSYSTNERFSNCHQYASSNQQDFDKKCFNSCKVTVDCNHHSTEASLFPGAHHTFTVTTGSQSPSGHLSPGQSSAGDAGLCEICSGVGSHSPTTARRREQFTSHFCTRVPEKRRSRDASIQTSFSSVPDVFVEEDSLTEGHKAPRKSTNISDGQIKDSSTKANTKLILPEASVNDTPISDDTNKNKSPESPNPNSSPCIKQDTHRGRQQITKEHPCPLTKLKRQTLSSGSLRKCPNLLMHSSTSAVQKYSFLSPKPLRKAPMAPTSGALNLKSCDTIATKPEDNADGSAFNKSWRTSKSKMDLNIGMSSHSISKDESLDSLKNSCSDLSRSDTGSSCSTISCSDCSYSTDSMSDTSSSTLEDGSISRSDSFEYADSFEYDDSFDKLRIEEKEKTWRKKAGKSVEGSASKDQIRHQKFADYLMKRSTTSPFPSWKSSNVSISTVYSDDDSSSSSSSSSSSVSDDGSMSELGWSFASKCNNPTRLNSLNSITSSVFDKQNSSRKLGPQKMDSLDSGSYSDSSQQTFCSQISVGRRETSLPKQIPSLNSSFSKAEKFGPVVNSLRKPGHHIGPSKNPNCSCATCVAHFDANESGKAKATRNESFDSFHDSDCSSGLDCEVP